MSEAASVFLMRLDDSAAVSRVLDLLQVQGARLQRVELAPEHGRYCVRIEACDLDASRAPVVASRLERLLDVSDLTFGFMGAGASGG
ncbi:MAG: hypothetical protein JO111_07775 [Caulobacteraceae bacterium]|nr:hypothetical protein [Caulobacteraceae bacterium]